MTTATITTTDLADKCIDLIRSYGHVTFMELKRVLHGEGIDPEGGECLEFAKCPNLLMWANMSTVFVDVVLEIQRRGDTKLDPTVPMVYAIDGGLLSLPIAKRPPKNGYKEYHWAPVVFNMNHGTPSATR